MEAKEYYDRIHTGACEFERWRRTCPRCVRGVDSTDLAMAYLSRTKRYRDGTQSGYQPDIQYGAQHSGAKMSAGGGTDDRVLGSGTR